MLDPIRRNRISLRHLDILSEGAWLTTKAG